MATSDSAPTEVTTQSGEPFQTRGRTTVRTRWGYAFKSANEGLPMIDEYGVKVTAEQADALVEESEGLVTKDPAPAAEPEAAPNPVAPSAPATTTSPTSTTTKEN